EEDVVVAHTPVRIAPGKATPSRSDPWVRAAIAGAPPLGRCLSGLPLARVVVQAAVGGAVRPGHPGISVEPTGPGPLPPDSALARVRERAAAIRFPAAPAGEGVMVHFDVIGDVAKGH